MEKLNIAILVTLSLIALCIDCYSSYFLFLIFVFTIAHYLHLPLILIWFVILLVPAFFIFTIISLCKRKRWAFWTFFSVTAFLSLILLYIYVFLYSFTKKNLALEPFQIFLISFFIVFTIYYLLPSTRRVFDK